MASRRVRVVVSSLDAFLDKILKKLALDIVANLVAAPGEGGTPVDTGWASSNWIPRIGSPVEAPAGSREAVSRGDQQAGVIAVAASYTLAKGRIYISNAVPYILKLNEGSSQQAPRNFVQGAIGRAIGGLL